MGKYPVFRVDISRTQMPCINGYRKLLVKGAPIA